MANLACLLGVEFAVIDEATIRLLDATRIVARPLPIPNVFITAGSNGVHSGPADPHYCGHALDIRSHNMLSVQMRGDFVVALQRELGTLFYVFLEDEGSANEHVHAQVKRGCAYPPALGLSPLGRTA